MYLFIQFQLFQFSIFFNLPETKQTKTRLELRSQVQVKNYNILQNRSKTSKTIDSVKLLSYKLIGTVYGSSDSKCNRIYCLTQQFIRKPRWT